MKNNNPKEIGYWDRLAIRMEDPVFQDQIALYKKRENLALVSAWLPSGRLKSVLKTDLFEEAFGKDSLIDALRLSFSSAVGMDVSMVVTEKAKKRFPEYPFLTTDVCSLPFKRGSFDLILSNSTLDHLPPDLLPAVIDELHKVLKPGGCLILTLDSRHNPLYLFSNIIRRWAKGIYAERCYTVKETCEILKKGSFEITDATAIYHIPPGVNFLAKKIYKVAGSRADRLIQYLINICHGLGQLPTRFISGRYIAIRAVKPVNKV